MAKALRTARRYWKLIAVSCFSLSIAMALGVLALSLSNTVLLLPPSGAEPDRLVMIYSHSAHEDIGEVSYPDYEYFRKNNHVFTDIGAAPNSIALNVDFADDGREVKLATRPVSENYFAVLGIRPFLGRFFTAGETAESSDEAVMSWPCWKRLGSKRDIIGKKLAGWTIVGVAPPSFTGGFYGANGDLFGSLRHDRDRAWMADRSQGHLMLTARLKAGMTRAQAQTEMAGLAGQLASAYPKEDKGKTAVLTRATLLPPDAIPDLKVASGVLMLLVLLVLLIACANVANLMLAAATGRRQEAAIKLAIGAPRGRLIREFLWESAALCAASGALGYGMAAAVAGWLKNFSYVFPIWGSFSFSISLGFDRAVLGLTIALVAIASVATGLAPALYASSPALAQILGGEVVVGGSQKNVRRNALVIVQVAVCTLVMVGMGLCQRNLYNMRNDDFGFSAHHLVALNVYTEAEGYKQAQAAEFYDKLRRTTAALPGVQAVTLAWDLPLFGSEALPIRVPGTDEATSPQTAVDDAYFATLGIPIVAGRAFDRNDREKAPEVAIVNRRMAEMYWKGKNPLGEVFMVGKPPRPVTIVGVAANTKNDIGEEKPGPFVYLPLSQDYRAGIQVIARTSGDPKWWVEPFRKAMRGLGLKVMVEPVTFAEWVDLDLFGMRVITWGGELLSGLGLLLAMVGLAGAVSYSVGQRRKELGIRVALGAQRRQLLAMLLRQSAVVAGAGVTIGLALGTVASALLQSQFYRMGAVEWTVLLPVTAVVMGLALVMTCLSAMPWLRVDPMEAVRHA
jgi:macrolide transport system ATP-binding/permease protein